ncbi:MAG: low molecular weight protein-tyrosine-phosphatase [Pseudomonadota bacterium]
MKILLVCTGNICRSPSAEGVLKELSRKENLDLHIDSAGTHDYHVGEAPDRRAVAHARRRGYDLSGLRARQVETADFERFDLILAMDRGHLRILERLCPRERRHKLRLFAAGEDVPDPYYGGPEEFERALDLIEAAARRLIDELRAHLRVST